MWCGVVRCVLHAQGALSRLELERKLRVEYSLSLSAPLPVNLDTIVEVSTVSMNITAQRTTAQHGENHTRHTVNGSLGRGFCILMYMCACVCDSDTPNDALCERVPASRFCH